MWETGLNHGRGGAGVQMAQPGDPRTTKMRHWWPWPKGCEAGWRGSRNHPGHRDGEEIDLPNRTATLEFEDGSTRIFPVRSDVDLGQRKVGEKVAFRAHKWSRLPSRNRKPMKFRIAQAIADDEASHALSRRPRSIEQHRLQAWAVVPPTALDTAVQQAKYRASEIGLRYSLQQTFTWSAATMPLASASIWSHPGSAEQPV